MKTRRDSKRIHERHAATVSSSTSNELSKSPNNVTSGVDSSDEELIKSMVGSKYPVVRLTRCSPISDKYNAGSECQNNLLETCSDQLSVQNSTSLHTIDNQLSSQFDSEARSHNPLVPGGSRVGTCTVSSERCNNSTMKTRRDKRIHERHAATVSSSTSNELSKSPNNVTSGVDSSDEELIKSMVGSKYPVVRLTRCSPISDKYNAGSECQNNLLETCSDQLSVQNSTSLHTIDNQLSSQFDSEARSHNPLVPGGSRVGSCTVSSERCNNSTMKTRRDKRIHERHAATVSSSTSNELSKSPNNVTSGVDSSDEELIKSMLGSKYPVLRLTRCSPISEECNNNTIHDESSSQFDSEARSHNPLVPVKHLRLFMGSSRYREIRDMSCNDLLVGGVRNPADVEKCWPELKSGVPESFKNKDTIDTMAVGTGNEYKHTDQLHIPGMFTEHFQSSSRNLDSISSTSARIDFIKNRIQGSRRKSIMAAQLRASTARYVHGAQYDKVSQMRSINPSATSSSSAMSLDVEGASSTSTSRNHAPVYTLKNSIYPVDRSVIQSSKQESSTIVGNRRTRKSVRRYQINSTIGTSEIISSTAHGLSNSAGNSLRGMENPPWSEEYLMNFADSSDSEIDSSELDESFMSDIDSFRSTCRTTNTTVRNFSYHADETMVKSAEVSCGAEVQFAPNLPPLSPPLSENIDNDDSFDTSYSPHTNPCNVKNNSLKNSTNNRKSDLMISSNRYPHVMVEPSENGIRTPRALPPNTAISTSHFRNSTMKRVWSEFEAANGSKPSDSGSAKSFKTYERSQEHHWQRWTPEQRSTFMKLQFKVSPQVAQYFSVDQNGGVDAEDLKPPYSTVWDHPLSLDLTRFPGTSNNMSHPLKKMDLLLNKKGPSRTVKEELARICVQEYASDNTRTLSMAYMDEVVNNNGTLMTSAAAAALTKKHRPLLSIKNKILSAATGSSAKKALKVSDLLLCPDEEFDLHVNITRRTIKKIFDAVKLEYPDFQYNDFLMLIWYLSSESSSPSKAAEIFEIPNEDDILSRLADTSSKLRWLQGSAKMELPRDEYDEDEIVECFKRRSELPNILGALGVMRLECLDGTWLNVLAIVDHDRYFRHLYLSSSSHVVQDVVRSSPIYERLLQDHPKHYTFLCPAEGYPSLPQLLPGLRDDEITLFDEMSDFDLRHNEVVSYVRTAVKEAVSRFPKLDSLESASREIVFAAFMLHNFCNQLRDTSIYNYDCQDQLYGGEV